MSDKTKVEHKSIPYREVRYSAATMTKAHMYLTVI